MSEYRYYGSRSSGAPAWILQRLTGILLVLLLVGHYILMHAVPANGHDWGAVADRLANPWYKAIQLGFVTIGMYHGVQGLWNVVRDFRLRPWLTLTIYGALVLTSVAFVAWGWNTMMTFDPLKP